MNENFLFEDQTLKTDIFSDYEDTPTEKNPFCNDSEYSSYNESYSHVIPTFFFRNDPLSIKPSRYESSRLRYFYSLSGSLLISGVLIKTILYLIFYVLILMYTGSLYHSKNSISGFFRQFICDNSVKYGLLSISAIISSAFVFKVGCRYSALKTSSFFRNNHSARTSEIISFFMTGIFLTSVYNLMYLTATFFPGIFKNPRPIFTDNIPQSLLIAMYTCIIVPVCEGFIFRGLVLKNMSRAGQRFGIIFTSLLCALSCGQFIEIIPCFMMSVLLCKITNKYGTLTHSVIMHVTVNICNTIILAYGDIFFNSNIFATQIWTFITFISGGFFAIYSFFKEPLPKSTKPQKNRSTKLIFRTFTIYLLIILYIFMMFYSII
ncbi:MAG: CPBP family intramembrane metalloprotease [Oscillospiraceae bacterium]|nr:CPBP family intramembrane metalloprotease [Oscillospiraceae bacterium]